MQQVFDVQFRYENPNPLTAYFTDARNRINSAIWTPDIDAAWLRQLILKAVAVGCWLLLLLLLDLCHSWLLVTINTNTAPANWSEY